MSSTRRIISAASAAEVRTWSLERKDSRTPREATTSRAMSPWTTSRPALEEPVAWAARSLVTSSEASKPPLSAMMAGMVRRARAKASMAKAFLPGTFGARRSTARAILISVQPPPGTVRVSWTTRLKTQRASCSDRSASSRTWDEAPRRMMEQASCLGVPEKRINRSSPTIKSSTRSHLPRTAVSGSSKVEQISAPKTAASRSTPSKSACSMAITLRFAKISSGKL
mmetsp:Transcript_25068/g.77373  ORF Transcript_25068/g.77373 Transcript_25068/m.77373 type:complete len:226 (+) Transcript_25068:362-1039(+)